LLLLPLLLLMLLLLRLLLLMLLLPLLLLMLLLLRLLLLMLLMLLLLLPLLLLLLTLLLLLPTVFDHLCMVRNDWHSLSDVATPSEKSALREARGVGVALLSETPFEKLRMVRIFAYEFVPC
jgi:hypothetical protein